MKARSSVTAYFGLSLLLAACVQAPGATRIVGPDGTSLFHVHCGDEQVACFQLAGDRCPSGYELSPVFDPHDGNFLVRCDSPHPPTVTMVKPPTAPPRPSASSTAGNDWPPVEVALPAEPWPAPPVTASTPVDIGY